MFDDDVPEAPHLPMNPFLGVPRITAILISCQFKLHYTAPMFLITTRHPALTTCATILYHFR
ncbi:hypothetical protein C3K23_02330 [Streptomyces sp. 604F]|nr:hypothetical protein C3K23_02330 [Streptomyces sp. 604F]